MPDVNKPITNPDFLAAVDAMRQDNSPENRNKAITEMMKAHFLAPVTIDPPPPAQEPGQPIQLGPGSKINFHLITNADNLKFFMAFTDWDELYKWQRNEGQQTVILTFDDYASLILKEDCDADGYVINPFGVNVVFTREQVRSLKEQKDLIEKGASIRTLNKNEPVKIGQPRVLPQELLDALSAQMKQMKNIASAYFAIMQQGEMQSFLIVVDFEGEKQEVFGALAEVARPHLGPMVISFTELDSELGENATRDQAPFYQKKRFGFLS